MGMDYIGRRPQNVKGKCLHLNWSGHSWLLSLLDQLGCNLDEWSGTNDGLRISARTCRAWAQTIGEALSEDHIVEAVYRDKSYVGDQRKMPVVRANRSIPLAELLPAHEISATAATVLALAEQFQGWKADENFQLLQPLDDPTRQWLQEIADFFANCGGCRQC